MLEFVYALKDPRLEGAAAVGYIGLTRNPNMRWVVHIGRYGKKTWKKNAWLEQLWVDGISPDMEILEVVYTGRAKGLEREGYWIQHYISQGAPLTNSQKVRDLVQQEEDENLVEDGPLVEEEPLLTNVSVAMPHDLTFPLAYLSEMQSRGIQETGPLHDLMPGWLRKNGLVYWVAGRLTSPPSPKYAWASLGILPLSKHLIGRLLCGEVSMYDIKPEDVLTYECGHTYVCYIPSVAYLEDRQPELRRLFQHALIRLCSLSVYISCIYISVAPNPENTSLLDFVTDHGFSYDPSISSSTWKLRPDAWGISSSIREYQKRIRQDIVSSLTKEFCDLTWKKEVTAGDRSRLNEIQNILFSDCGVYRLGGSVVDPKWIDVPDDRHLSPFTTGVRGLALGEPD